MVYAQKPQVPDVIKLPPRNNLLKDVCAKVGATLEQLQSRDAHRDISRKRYEAMTLLTEAGWSYSRTGRALKRDHTTVIYGLKVHAARAAQKEAAE